MTVTQADIFTATLMLTFKSNSRFADEAVWGRPGGRVQTQRDDY